MSARDGSRRRVLTREERTLWSTFTRSIAPLRNDTSSTTEEEPEQAIAAPAARPTSSVAHSASPPAQRQPLAPPLALLGRRMRTRVARGREAIDARIDLHGLTQSEAHAALLQFLRSASARGARLVLVITGKGRRGDRDRGVLRRQVPQWLGLNEFRPFVIGFEDAHIAHGGEGALYVRVRKTRGS
jgi:DNA-nicking Smr family endonuclease